MAGLFFCLASAEGCRAFALLCCNVATHKRLQRVLHRKCNYTANTAKQHTGLYRGFFWDLSHSTATNTRPAQAAIIPPVPRWSAHTRPDALHRYQIQPPCRTLHSSAQPPIIIRYIRVRPFYGSMPYSAADRRPCKPGGVSSCRLQIAGKRCTRRIC